MYLLQGIIYQWERGRSHCGWSTTKKKCPAKGVITLLHLHPLVKCDYFEFSFSNHSFSSSSSSKNVAKCKSLPSSMCSVNQWAFANRSSPNWVAIGCDTHGHWWATFIAKTTQWWGSRLHTTPPRFVAETALLFFHPQTTNLAMWSFSNFWRSSSWPIFPSRAPYWIQRAKHKTTSILPAKEEKKTFDLSPNIYIHPIPAGWI